MAEIAQVMDRYKPSPDPWKDQFLSEIASVMDRFSYAMLNPQPLPPSAAAWPGVREPAHMMAATQWANEPLPNPWRQIMAKIAQVLGRHGPTPEPWKDQLLSEIASVMDRFSYAMLNPQPLPPVAAAWPGVREPAHMMVPQRANNPNPSPWLRMPFPGVKEPVHQMMTNPWWSSDPAQMAAMQPQMPQQMLSEMAAVLRRYGFQI
jgi:ribosomal protein S10